MRIKHFDPGLIGWEAKDASQERHLITSDGHTLNFEGISYKLEACDELIIEILVREGETEKG